MNTKKFDVIVIGAGTGLDIMSFAADQGMKVALIEEGPMGGTCLNRGCIPSKMLIHAADVAEIINGSKKFGIHSTINKIDFASLVNRVSESVDRESQEIEEAIRKSNNITLFKERAEFTGQKTLKTSRGEIQGEKVFIVGGTRPDIPSFPGIEKVEYMTSTDALRLTTLPKKLIVIGGGYIAAELAHFFGALGSNISIIERSSRLLSNEDTEISDWFTREFSRKYNVYLDANVKSVTEKGNDIIVTAENEAGKIRNISGDKLLIATGRKPNTDILNLKATGVEMDEKGYIKVNEYLETNVKNIWALGDIVGILPFKHTANYQGEHGIQNAFLGHRHAMNYSTIGHVVFSSPQIAGVGKTEDELKKEHIPYRVGRYEYKDTGMGEALLENGLVKVLVAKDSDDILGCHIIGHEASILIHEVILAMKSQKGIRAITDSVFVHPALSEVVQRAFHSIH